MTLKKNLTGTNIGGWTVLHRDDSVQHPVRWICQCKCGAVRSIAATNLMRHPNASCRACGAKKRSKGERTGLTLLWHRLKSHAKLRGIPFRVTKDELYDLFLAQGRVCALSGVEIRLVTHRADFDAGKTTASVDRVRSDGCYEIGNVQWVHKDVNRLKNCFSEDDLLFWCEAITTHQESKKETNMAQQHFLSKVRWVLSSFAMRLPQVYFDEAVARRKAQAIEQAQNTVVHIDRQELVEGEWISVEAAAA